MLTLWKWWGRCLNAFLSRWCPSAPGTDVTTSLGTAGGHSKMCKSSVTVLLNSCSSELLPQGRVLLLHSHSLPFCVSAPDGTALGWGDPAPWSSRKQLFSMAFPPLTRGWVNFLLVQAGELTFPTESQQWKQWEHRAGSGDGSGSTSAWQWHFKLCWLGDKKQQRPLPSHPAAPGS